MLALVIVVGVLVINLAIWVPIILKLRQLSARMANDLAGQHIERGPERASFSGATAAYGKVRGMGKLALTERRLVFYKALGAPVEIARADIASVRTERSFLGWRSSRPHLVVHTNAGADVGFMVADSAAWLAALATVSSAARG